MKCSYVPIDRMGLDGQMEVWLQILPFVKKLVTQSNGRVSETSLLEECRTGQVNLWICYEEKDGNPVPAVFICTKVRVYPTGLKLLSYEYCGGERIDEWFDIAHEVITKWCLTPTEEGGAGCDGLEIIGRLGWHRYLKPKGWEQLFTVYELRFDTG